MSKSVAYQLDHLLNVTLLNELACWFQPKLEAIHGAEVWWRHGVFEKLSEAQKRWHQNIDNGKLTDLDLQALLHVISKNFRDLVDQCAVSWDLRTPLESVRGARNALSHRKGGRGPSPDDLLLFALNAKKLLSLIEAAEDAIDSAGNVVKAITDPEFDTHREATRDDFSGKPRNGKVDSDAGQREAQGCNKSPDVPPEDLTSKEDTTSSTADRADSLEEANQDPCMPAGTDVDPSCVPLPGMNPVVSARLTSCTSDGEGKWTMSLKVKTVDGEDQNITLAVPIYLSGSAHAAADILNSKEGRDDLLPVYIKLINVSYEDGRFKFPDNPRQENNAYPLLVIQPSYLINVTSLTHFDYCPRNYLMDRYSISKSNQPMQRGALVHSVFDFMLRNPDDRDGLIAHCHEETDQQLPELTMQGVTVAQHYEDVRPHLNALASSVQQALDPKSFEDLFIERYMINPDLGLKGKIDALVKKTNGHWQAIELKTGKSWGAEANVGHAFQVGAYQLLLSQSSIGPLDPPLVVYTGNQAKRIRDGEPLLSAGSMVKETAFTAATAIDMMNLRNELVRIDYCGDIDFNTNENKCRACVRLGKATHCVTLHALGLSGGDWHSEHIEPLMDSIKISEKHQELFRVMNKAMCEEFHSIKINHGQLLQASTEYRVAQGKSLRVCLSKEQSGENELRLEFPEGNSSEFREGDPCLLSDARGPVRGNCAEVYVSSITKREAVVTLPKGIKQLWFDPEYLDVNAPDSAFERNFAALFSIWAQQADGVDTLASVREFLAGNSDAFRLNSEIDTVLGNIRPHPLPIQKKAIQLALGLKDVLLIQGPPGTGKTYTLALAVKSLVEDGQCVAISTYTHRAADEVMSKLLTLAPDLEVRKLGRPEAVASQYTDRCLSRLFQREESIRNLDRDSLVADLTSRQQSIEDVLSTSAVYIGTTHAWLSGKYDDLPKVISKGEKNQFDVVVIDEASQVITPNLVGAMRLASRWILVGDHKQLPPIVISDNSEILGKTLFESIAEHPDRCKNLLVQLETQHRMPQALADFIGSTFYNNKLYTSNEVAKRNRSIACNITRFNTEHCITLIEVGSESKDTHFKQFAEEADWIADTIKELYDHKWPIRNGSNKPTIGVIAPFRAQVALLRRTLEKRFDGNIDHDFWNDVVDTVDRFQGDEREIIILSLCLSRDDAKVPRVYEDGRRINVALSRAKCKLWVVGCINEMKNIPVLSAFRNYAEAHPDSCAVVTYKKSTSVEELF